MKALHLTFTVLVTVFLLLPGFACAQDDDQGVSFQTFYDNLGSQGEWIQTDNYGYVFQPTVSDPDWAPYTDGHWVNTDEGWTWVSDEPWGWATYHYGRWANIDGTGWVWVPGNRWAPAWVSWRYGGGYAGWAPLPPESFVGGEYEGNSGLNIGIGFHFGGDVDVNFNIGAGCYNFIGVGDFGENNYHGRYQPRYSNYTIINRTTNITNITVNKTVINNYNGAGAGGANFRGVRAGGPPLAEINAHSRTRVQTVKLAEANQPGRATMQGGSLAVYAPHVKTAKAGSAKPANVTRTIDHPTFNRGSSIDKPLEVTQNVKPKAPTQSQIQAAQAAQAHVPASAKIAKANSMPKSAASMAPVRPTEGHVGEAASGGEATDRLSKPVPMRDKDMAPNRTTENAPKPEVASRPLSGDENGAPVHHHTPVAADDNQPAHHTSMTPANAVRPQGQGAGAEEITHHHANTSGSPSRAPEPTGSGAQAFHSQSASAPASHPAAQGQGGGKPAGGGAPKPAPGATGNGAPKPNQG